MLKKTNIKPLASTVSKDEISRFSKLAATWWDESGPMKPLHQMNPVRLAYIRDWGLGDGDWKDLHILDVGCGAGLLAEPLARVGAKVTAIDASEQNIEVAKAHAAAEGVKVDYRFTTAEDLANPQHPKPAPQFDIVTALEIIEHVSDVEAFLDALSALVKPGGKLFISTLNRTVMSYLFAKLGAEYVLRILPVGTHDWRKFLTPSEVILPAEKRGLKLLDKKGMIYNPVIKSWALGRSMDVNYILCFEKAA